MKDYYEVLEIAQDASQDEVKSAYKELVKIYHPDRLGDISEQRRKKIESKLKEVNEAYETLSDPLKRAEYDHWYNYSLEEPETSSSEPSSMKDYYDVLGVDQNASFDEIESVYLQLKQFYSENESQMSQAKLREIEKAYQILSERVSKATKDKKPSKKVSKLKLW